MSLQEQLVKSIRRSVMGKAWHGPSLKEAIEGLEPEQAWFRAVPSAHSIVEIVLHVTAWMDEVTSRLAGQPHDAPAAGDFPDPGPMSADQWQTHQYALEAAAHRLATETEEMSESRLADRIRGVLVSTMLAGVAEHNTYHAGQIGILRKV